MYSEDRIAVLDALREAGSSVLRIFISYTPSNNKDTGSVEMPDIEPVTVGVWDDTQLEAIDQLMVEAEPRGTFIASFLLSPCSVALSFAPEHTIPNCVHDG